MPPDPLELASLPKYLLHHCYAHSHFSHISTVGMYSQVQRVLLWQLIDLATVSMLKLGLTGLGQLQLVCFGATCKILSILCLYPHTVCGYKLGLGYVGYRFKYLHDCNEICEFETTTVYVVQLYTCIQVEINNYSVSHDIISHIT